MTDLEPDLDYGGPAVRMLPQDLVAEQSVLGALMLSRDAREAVIGGRILDTEDFYQPVHQMVFDAVVALHSAGEPADAVTVAGELSRRGELKRVGGHVALHTLVSTVPTAANAGYYARIVREQAVLRRLVTAGMKVTQLGYAAEGGDADTLVGAALKELEAVGPVGRAQVDEPLADTVTALMSAIVDGDEDPTEQFHWPFYDLRKLLGGARPGQVVIVAARPSIGKSTLLDDMLRCFAIEQGLSVDLWTMEMPKHEVLERLLSAEASVPLHSIREREVKDEHLARLWEANGRIADANLRIYPDGGTLNDIAASIRKHKTRVALYDYLQLVPMPYHVKTPEQRRMELGAFSRGLKKVAKTEDCLIVVAAQLNRASEARQDKVPQVADLRESGDFEQDADVVALLHRPDFYDKESPRSGEADIIIGKNRNGETGIATVAHQLHLARFVDMYRGDER